MNDDMDDIGTVEKPAGTLKILAHLNKHEKATVTSLIEDVNLSQTTAHSALDRLLNKGLICQEATDSFPMCEYYMLTHKGCKVAKNLQKMAYLIAQEYDY